MAGENINVNVFAACDRILTQIVADYVNTTIELS